MRHLILPLTCLVLLSSGSAQAQFPVPVVAPSVGGAAPFARPTVSPYLNLLRSNSPVLNYYGLVRPELQMRAAEQHLRRDVGRVQRTVQGWNEQRSDDAQSLRSGHSARFGSDLRGTDQIVTITLRERRLSALAEDAPLNRRLPASGHRSFFDTRYEFFQPPVGALR
jgi:hypothetical protein